MISFTGGEENFASLREMTRGNFEFVLPSHEYVQSWRL